MTENGRNMAKVLMISNGVKYNFMDKKFIARTITICEDCYNLKGQMCHNPQCIFCRRTMKEVAEVLDILLIRPVVDGERIKL